MRPSRAFFAAIVLALSFAAHVAAAQDSQRWLEDITRTNKDYNEASAAFQRGDYKSAARVYRQLANRGEGYAQFVLAMMYWQGQGVLEDFVRAHMWLNLSSQADTTPVTAPATENMKTLEKLMTPAQIAEAQRLARVWAPK